MNDVLPYEKLKRDAENLNINLWTTSYINCYKRGNLMNRNSLNSLWFWSCNVFLMHKANWMWLKRKQYSSTSLCNLFLLELNIARKSLTEYWVETRTSNLFFAIAFQVNKITHFFNFSSFHCRSKGRIDSSLFFRCISVFLLWRKVLMRFS